VAHEGPGRCIKVKVKRSSIRALAMVLGVVLSAAPLHAHHSFAAEYDAKKPTTLTGSVTKVEWSNPHVRFYIDVKDQAGTVTNWRHGDGGRVPGEGRLASRQRAGCHAERRPKDVRRHGCGRTGELMRIAPSLSRVRAALTSAALAALLLAPAPLGAQGSTIRRQGLRRIATALRISTRRCRARRTANRISPASGGPNEIKCALLMAARTIR
jgi:hypothetical protein